jgi:hypothetical protein
VICSVSFKISVVRKWHWIYVCLVASDSLWPDSSIKLLLPLGLPESGVSLPVWIMSVGHSIIDLHLVNYILFFFWYVFLTELKEQRLCFIFCFKVGKNYYRYFRMLKAALGEKQLQEHNVLNDFLCWKVMQPLLMILKTQNVHWLVKDIKNVDWMKELVLENRSRYL